MIAHAARLSFGLLLIVSAATLAVSAQGAGPGSCREAPEFYERADYTIRRVRIDTPLSWLTGVERSIDDLLASLPISEGARFKKEDYQSGFLELSRRFPELRVSRNSRLAIRLERPSLELCDSASRTLDVVYHVYTLGFAPYLSRVFERKNDELSRSVIETPGTRRLARYFLQPFIGYDPSRRFYGGGSLSIGTSGRGRQGRQGRPDAPYGNLLDRINVSGFGSSASAQIRLDASGARDFASGSIAHSEWDLRYLYSNEPGRSFEINQGLLSAQIFAATHPRGDREVVLRFGGAIEGGHKQTDLRPTDLQSSDLASTRYGALKVFLGASMRSGAHAFKGSYGLKLGQAGDRFRVDFVKQIFDVAYQARVLPHDHRPVSVDARFTAGVIHQVNQLPAAERFFGGNIEQHFTSSDSWTIGSGPFIRSFPQNGLTRVAGVHTVGGDRFFSANLTMAATVWGIPLIPPVVLEDPELGPAFELAMSAAESSLQNDYVSGSRRFREIAARVRAIPTRLDEVAQTLARVEGQRPSTQIRDQVAECRIELETVAETTRATIQDLDTDRAKTADVRKLAVGFPTRTPPIASYLEDLTVELATLRGLLDQVMAAEVDNRIESLAILRRTIASEFQAFEKSVDFEDAARRAQREMRYPRRVINDLMREANLIAISPVVVFDAARIWQRGTGSGDTRYGVGGGVRVSIVSFDITAGYAWNVSRLPGERRGAWLVTLELSNLFR